MKRAPHLACLIYVTFIGYMVKWQTEAKRLTTCWTTDPSPPPTVMHHLFNGSASLAKTPPPPPDNADRLANNLEAKGRDLHPSKKMIKVVVSQQRQSSHLCYTLGCGFAR